MNYYRYYTGPGKSLSRTFQLTILAHPAPDDSTTVLRQTINIRATSPQEAADISLRVRDTRLNRLYTSTNVSDLSGISQLTISSDPILFSTEAESVVSLQDYQVTVIREAGPSPFTGEWYDYTEDHLTIQAPDEQQAYRLANFISGLPFRGQFRRTLVNGAEHLDERV